MLKHSPVLISPLCGHSPSIKFKQCIDCFPGHIDRCMSCCTSYYSELYGLHVLYKQDCKLRFVVQPGVERGPFSLIDFLSVTYWQASSPPADFSVQLKTPLFRSAKWSRLTSCPQFLFHVCFLLKNSLSCDEPVAGLDQTTSFLCRNLHQQESALNSQLYNTVSEGKKTVVGFSSGTRSPRLKPPQLSTLLDCFCPSVLTNRRSRTVLLDSAKVQRSQWWHLARSEETVVVLTALCWAHQPSCGPGPITRPRIRWEQWSTVRLTRTVMMSAQRPKLFGLAVTSHRYVWGQWERGSADTRTLTDRATRSMQRREEMRGRSKEGDKEKLGRTWLL